MRYDCIRDKYIEVEFGNFKSKLMDLFKNGNIVIPIYLLQKYKELQLDLPQEYLD